MGPGSFREARRRTLVALGATVTTSLWPDAFAQALPYDHVNPTSARSEFDIEGGKVVLLEYASASERLRSIGSSVGIRFQIANAYLGPRWAPLVGFSIGSENGLRQLQVNFADLPIHENLLITADLLNFEPRPREKSTLAQVLAPKFKRRDVHDIQIRFESESVVALVIDGKRRPFEINFRPHRLIVRASGVKGWVEFVEPGVA